MAKLGLVFLLSAVFFNTAFGWTPFSKIECNEDPCQSKSLANYPLDNAVDGDNQTFWVSADDSHLPTTVILDAGSTQAIYGFAYTPRQDIKLDGIVGQYAVETSADKKTWNLAAEGTFYDDSSKKVVGFETTHAQFVRFTAKTEAGDRGPRISAAEFAYVVEDPSVDSGRWGPVIPFPLVPVAAFVDVQTGKVVTFSSAAKNAILTGSNLHGSTFTALFDPATNTAAEAQQGNTQHDMFCPGMSLDFEGQVLVTGGEDTKNASLWSPERSQWEDTTDMQTGRGYQAQVTTSKGDQFVIGASWGDLRDLSKNGENPKNGELYNPGTHQWKMLPESRVLPMWVGDDSKIDLGDSHGWLFAWKEGFVFQAGPSKSMHWYDTAGAGSVTPAGSRADDGDALNGPAVMYDAAEGKIVTFGGAPQYSLSQPTDHVHLITIDAPKDDKVKVEKLTSMKTARGYANAVVLPTGQVFVVGGQSYSNSFDDVQTVWEPEMWDPVTHELKLLPAMDVPRNYHSVALLLPDGRVFTGGGGLCGTCGFNHQDAQIYSPAYLFKPDGSLRERPIISDISKVAPELGSSITVTVTSGEEISEFSIIRYGSVTHTVNTDQRRIPLKPTKTEDKTYTIQLPEDPGIAIPGFWMLFALDKKGTPSVSMKLKIAPVSRASQ